MTDVIAYDEFNEFTEATWKHKSNTAFVEGIGYVNASVKDLYSEKPPKIQYMLHKIDGDVVKISKDRAEELVNQSEDWISRSTLRRDTVVSSLAEEMAENYAKSDPAGKSDDYDSKTWPYLAETEKDQWRAVAKFTIDRLKKLSVS